MRMPEVPADLIEMVARLYSENGMDFDRLQGASLVSYVRLDGLSDGQRSAHEVVGLLRVYLQYLELNNRNPEAWLDRLSSVLKAELGLFRQFLASQGTVQ